MRTCDIIWIIVFSYILNYEVELIEWLGFAIVRMSFDAWGKGINIGSWNGDIFEGLELIEVKSSK